MARSVTPPRNQSTPDVAEQRSPREELHQALRLLRRWRVFFDSLGHAEPIGADAERFADLVVEAHELPQVTDAFVRRLVRWDSVLTSRRGGEA